MASRLSTLYNRLPRGVARWVCLMLLIALGLNLLLLSQEIPNTFDCTKSVVTGATERDSWAPMLIAWNALPHTQGPSLYDMVLTHDFKFQYPASSLLPFSVLKLLGIPLIQRTFKCLSWVFLGLTFWGISALAIELTRRLSNHGVRVGDTDWKLAVPVALATLFFYPTVKAYELGQIQCWLNALFVLSCLAWVKNRKGLAGICIGLICLVKPQFGLFLIWGILRREWSFVIAWTLITIPGQLAAMVLYGPITTLEYVQFLQFISHHGESSYLNQSMNGLLNRFLFNGENLTWMKNTFAPYHPVVYYGTLASSLLLLLPALFWKIRKSDRGNILDFATAALTFTLCSPVAWEHHYGILPPIFLMLACCVASLPEGGRKRFLLVLLGTSFLLAANYFDSAKQFATTHANLLQSYLYFSALVVLGLLYYFRRQMPSERVVATPIN